MLAILIQSVQQGNVLERLIGSLISIIVCLEREGSKPQAGGDFKSPSEKVNERKTIVSFLTLTLFRLS